MKALVYKSTGSWYQVKDENGHRWNARIKGVFKIGQITSTNPLAVGDWVDIEEENKLESTAMITFIHDRHNYIARSSPHKKGKQHHIIAANLDQALLFATLREPRTSQGFIDRFLVMAEAYHIPTVLVFNKSDLYEEAEMALFEHYRNMYENIGYTVLLVSVQNETGLADLATLMQNKTSLISGHSGVGKSSFINTISSAFSLRTQDVSNWSGKGMHTTTFAEMFDLEEGGHIIDTPGIRELGLVDISRQELSHYFREMRALIPACQFNNCLHTHEPGCAVKEAVRNGTITEDRYVSYCTLLEGL